MANVLEIKHLHKNYKGFSLKDISFYLPAGYIMGLIGPNGAGKTTIIKLIMNLISRHSGEISVFGKDNIRNEVEIKSKIGFVYDNHPFYEDVKLQAIKQAVSLFYTAWDEDVFNNLVDLFELQMNKKYGKLSQGMKMKFALALALSHHAELIIMDEPTSGLDPVFRRSFLEMLAELIQDEKKSILFSTHITSDLDKIADYITFIQNGELVFSSIKDDITENWGVVKGGHDLLNNGTRHLFKGFRKNEYGLQALTADVREVKKHVGHDVLIEKATLEDIMFFMNSGGSHA